MWLPIPDLSYNNKWPQAQTYRSFFIFARASELIYAVIQQVASG